ncbi:MULTISPECIES: barstar family protein [unclassified Corynebacterium]|uniref:barstar family protein n=1 Tax=unclassified Corynebacterium TaxID=2624378 RepID=UPI0008A40693|nr:MULTISPECIES: barstar family protein [unclassified Corynebacterium]OFO95940.1 competence protein ComFC [Corynebacterium sp. HMSC034H07]OFP29310.1 competence protein ComFC [Corynebacterium sp. HMSC068G04]
MQRILITEPIRTREDFYGALGRLRGCQSGAPRNLDALADFLREQHIVAIIAADFDMVEEDLTPISMVLKDQGVALVR